MELREERGEDWRWKPYCGPGPCPPTPLGEVDDAGRLELDPGSVNGILTAGKPLPILRLLDGNGGNTIGGSV